MIGSPSPWGGRSMRVRLVSLVLTAVVCLCVALGVASPASANMHLPVVTSVSPVGGSVSGGTLLTVSGKRFKETSQVTVGGAPARIVVVSADSVQVIAPPGRSVGPGSVRVTTREGTSAPNSDAAFLYIAVPVVTSLTPSEGPGDVAQKVSIRGTHLEGTRAVTFNGVPGTELLVVSSTEVQVLAPPARHEGNADVRITTNGGTSVPSPAATFKYAELHMVTLPRQHGWLPFGLIGVLSWCVWLIRRYLSRHRYDAVFNSFTTTTSVIVPVYREDPNVLKRCLQSWLKECPTEIVLVVDDRDIGLLDLLSQWDFANVRVLQWRHRGKRGALGAGVRAAAGEVVVFADSDTSWRPGLLRAIQRPFVDSTVGGVGSRQHVHLPDSSIWRRIAYWMLNCRYLDYVPAMSRRGSVACLSGRTAAYRRSLITPLLPALEHEMFLGRECVAGDDGRLTWLVLAAGYKTVHQATAEADSMFPGELRAFVLQRIRWSRNSYRCYLTAAAQGWLWRQPLVTQVTVLQILLTPVTMGATIWYGMRWIQSGGWLVLFVVLVWGVLGRALRALSHLQERPRDVILAPVMALVIAVIALPIKLLAGLTMNRQGWLTRVDTARVLGQAEITEKNSVSVS